MTALQAGHRLPTDNKADYVRDMFAGIAHRYDLLNSVLSFRLHKSWRRHAVGLAGLGTGDKALDVCTGTGDFAIELWRAVGPTGLVAGADFCEPMVRLGRDKAARIAGGRIGLAVADVMRLPYHSGIFDCVTVGFGIRNVADIQASFVEMTRVLKPGGHVVCLEFARPPNPLWRSVSGFYQLCVLPRVGAVLSRADAYRYLPESIQVFTSRAELTGMMEQAGLIEVGVHDLCLGCVAIHIGTKP